MTPPAPLLEARGLAKSFGAVVALRSADLSVRDGEIHALMGANGAGKSTLVKMLTGVIRPDSGEIALRGRVRPVRSPAEARRAGLVPVYQDPALVPDLTVGENLRLTRSDAASVRRWLDELGVSGVDFADLARDLPQATLRLVDLARALASEPGLLLLDEITAALPVDVTDRVFGVVREWRARNRSVIFITHRLAEVSALCDRATVLRDGLTVGVVDPAAGSGEQIVSLMLGPAAAAAPRDRVGAATGSEPDGRDPAEPVLEVRDLSLGGALTGVSFRLRPGEVLGVAALEGQGQQELFDCLAGVRRPDAGTIVADGRPLSFHHPADAIRAGLTLVPADRLQALMRQRSVRENIALPLIRSPRRWGPINLGAERRRVADAIERLRIDTRAQSQVRRLSGGNQQKVTLARWLASGFRILLCFDPTRGIDIGTKRQIYALVRELATQGHAVLLFTSELPEIQLACDRVLVLFGGRIVQELPAADADEPAVLRAAHGLTAEMAAALAQAPHTEVG